MNKIVYGKPMENLRERIKFRSVNNVKDYKNWVSMSIFVSQKIFSETFVAIDEIKPVLTLDKPIYVGFRILDLKETRNSYFCVTPKNHRLILVSLKY